MTSSREEFLRVSHLAASGGQPASTTTPQSNMTRRRHLAKSAPHRASDNMSLKSKRPSCKTLIGLHLYIFVISSLLISISQLSCQTSTNSHEENGPRPAGDGAADALAPCNQKRQHQETGSRAGQQRALKHLDGPTLQQRANQIANPLPSTRRHLLNQQGARQQRQFNQLHSRSAALSEAPQTQPPPASEEFSLSSLTSSGPAPASGQSEQGNATSYAMISSDSEALASGSAPTAAPPNSSLASNQLDALGNASLSTAISSTGSSVYKTETGETENTTPALAAETIGSPVAPQPFATTSSSVKPGSQAESPHPQQQQRQQARRIEESSTLVVDRHSSSPSDDNHLDGPGRAPSSFTAKSAISSMPSSTSIITPLVGPPAMASQQQQAQQMISTPTSSSSSMVKPIYVVGNPIGDLDYSSTIYNEQQAVGAKQKTVDFAAAKVVGQPQRVEKRVDSSPTAPSSPAGQDESSAQENRGHIANTTSNYAAEANQSGPSVVNDGDRMNGPALVYSDGQLVAGGSSLAAAANQSSQATPPPPSPLSAPAEPTANGQQQGGQHTAGSSLPAPSPRLVQGLGSDMGSSASVLASTPRRPSLPPPVNQANAASGLRSPLSPSGPLLGQPPANSPISAGNSLQQPANSQQHLPNFYQTSPPYVGGASGSHLFANSQLASNSAAGPVFPSMLSNKQAFILASQQQQQQQQQHQSQQQQQQQQPPHISAIASQFQLPIMHTQQPGSQPQASITNQQAVGPSRRPLNITRVEHISAECSNDLIRAVIVFNGTFKGIIYSSGYVNDPTCLYVNGTGTTRYEFSIRLNQCGTLGRQELHQPTVPGEARRRDQVMWNTLSIQYNPVIEQEWDEHFRVSCEYGSDFWKTISFSPFNVETSTGSPVVFTINPPQCQMDVLLGHGMGPKIAVDGPVTVGDPLTLLIHMKSEKAGYDILVKNCVAHNGGKQRMQLIDSNGCVVNERFISPFRGTYNDNDLRHVTLYAYLKAFRFTGSPVLYLECEIHMCQSACPPQMCYWRRLSKRSVDNNDFEYTDDRASLSNITANELGDDDGANSTRRPVISDSLSLFKALQVRHEPVEPSKARLRAQQLQEIYAEDEEAQLVCYRHAEVMVFMATIGALLLLVLSVAITCCLRIRKMTRSQFKHSRMQTQAGSQSISPSLLSFDESCSQASPSLIGGFSGGPSNGQTPSISSFFLQRASDHLPANKPTKQQLANANLLFKQRQQNNQCHSSGNNIIRDKKSYPTSSGQAMTSANMYTFNT